MSTKGVVVLLGIIIALLLVAILATTVHANSKPGYDETRQATCALLQGQYVWDEGARVWMCDY